MTLDSLEVLSNHLDCKSADLGKQFAQPPSRVSSSHNSEALSIGVRATVTVPLRSPKHHSATQRVWSKAKNELCNNKVFIAKILSPSLMQKNPLLLQQQNFLLLCFPSWVFFLFFFFLRSSCFLVFLRVNSLVTGSNREEPTDDGTF